MGSSRKARRTGRSAPPTAATAAVTAQVHATATTAVSSHPAGDRTSTPLITLWWVDIAERHQPPEGLEQRERPEHRASRGGKTERRGGVGTGGTVRPGGSAAAPPGTTAAAVAPYPTAVSDSGPAGAAAYVSGGGLQGRRLLALAVATVVFAAAAAVLLRGPEFDVDDVQLVVWSATGLRLAEQRWWPRRAARLVWAPQVAGRDAVESGLVARRSLAGWATLPTGLAWAAPVR